MVKQSNLFVFRIFLALTLKLKYNDRDFMHTRLQIGNFYDKFGMNNHAFTSITSILLVTLLFSFFAILQW